MIFIKLPAQFLPSMNTKEKWLSTGYQAFAREGSHGIKVESLSRIVGKNKSTFYHHFFSTDIFLEDLTMRHLEQAKVMAQRLKASQDLKGLIEGMLFHQEDLFFNRYLRVERDVPIFESCFQETNAFVGDAFLQTWSTILEFNENSQLARLFLKICVDNFFLRLSPKTLNAKWLEQYFIELRDLVRAFMEAHP